ncbi:MAG: phosphoglucosamine mutase [Ruminococcaceae bacterium]|nr:phosphoglucosamine mutase [Oscillospiraceae bacterium]
MTVGEKIIALRTSAKLSQEQLAEKLSVSRQSVSKWEMDQAVPQIDKILQLSSLFSVTTDELLREDVAIGRLSSAGSGGGERKNRYFGTDGFRGEANVFVTGERAFKVGRYLGWFLSREGNGSWEKATRPRVVIGKDTRRSSYMLEYAITAGLTASGADVYMLHVTTTPSVSYVTRNENFDCGIMISASHNGFADNGIKILNRYGEKLDDATVEGIEAYLDGDMAALGVEGDLPLATGERMGCIIDHVAGRNRYMGYLISIASHSYRNIRVGLDCANGAAWMIAQSVFNALGATVTVINAEPDGTNINRNAGSTHIEALSRCVREKHLDVGFAFDGDADRCIAVDENGNEVNGDHILYILAKRLKSRGSLDNNTVVTTVMSNTGLTAALDREGIKYIRTAVGDRYVYEAMTEKNFKLGGEQSGHIILQKYATTGDGILTAIMIMEEMLDRKFPLAKLAEPVKMVPQLLRNVPVKSKPRVMGDPDILAAAERINEALSSRGRLLLRESGTEQVIRIMVECPDGDECQRLAGELEALIRDKGYAID